MKTKSPTETIKSQKDPNSSVTILKVLNEVNFPKKETTGRFTFKNTNGLDLLKIYKESMQKYLSNNNIKTVKYRASLPYFLVSFFSSNFDVKLERLERENNKYSQKLPILKLADEINWPRNEEKGFFELNQEINKKYGPILKERLKKESSIKENKKIYIDSRLNITFLSILLKSLKEAKNVNCKIIAVYKDGSITPLPF
jgi:hypothetical protein